MQQLRDDRVLRRHRLGVLDEVSQGGLLVGSDGHIQAYRVTTMREQIGDLVGRNSRFLGELLFGGLPPEDLVHLTFDPGELVDLLDEVHGQPDGAALVSHAAGDGLTNPPGGVGRELEALGVVELLHRPDQSQIALLDQIKKWHSPAGVTLGQRHHEAQVGFQEVLSGRLTVGGEHREVAFALVAQTFAGLEQVLGVQTGLDALGEFHLVFRAEQGGLADAVQIHAHKISGRTCRVQIACESGGAGVCHGGLLIGSNCH